MDNLEGTKRCAAADALLEAASRLFTEKGYEAVSTRELADAAGVNLASIQYHFGSKEKLFVETVRRLMGDGGCRQAAEALTGVATTKEEAAHKLCRYVKASLHDLVHRNGPQPCRIMFREILNHSNASAEMHRALINFVVEDMLRPFDMLLISILRVLAPDKSSVELEWCAHSIAGQISFYLTHRPFYKQLRGQNLSDQNTLNVAARQVSEFSLRGMGLREELVRAAIDSAFSTELKRESKAA